MGTRTSKKKKQKHEGVGPAVTALTRSHKRRDEGEVKRENPKETP